MLKVIVLMLLSFSACADEWRTSDTARATVLIYERLIDIHQTKQFNSLNGCATTGQAPTATQSNSSPYTVTNGTLTSSCRQTYESDSAWAIGEHPSNSKINLYFGALTVLEVVVAYNLPHGWRDAFQYVRIIDMGNTINRNHRNLGVGFSIGF